MKLDFIQILPSIPYIAMGIFVTLKYTIISVFFGFLLGGALGVMKVSEIVFLKRFSQAYTSIFRGSPLLVQLMIVYHGVPYLWHYKISAFEAGIIAFSLNSAAYVSEIIRSGILSVDKGQFEAAASLGISYYSTMKDIIMPQALRNILPGLVNETTSLLKESALVSVLGEADLLRRANIVGAEKYTYFEPLLFVTLIYYIMVVSLSYVAKFLEIRLRRSD